MEIPGKLRWMRIENRNKIRQVKEID
jgi:hypothetical protein